MHIFNQNLHVWTQMSVVIVCSKPFNHKKNKISKELKECAAQNGLLHEAKISL